ncbi:MAG: hypothetical protein Q8941_15540 [Bacteroidota bacterium]|nr:hypothetical protein [Bacteroidota bacterium]
MKSIVKPSFYFSAYPLKAIKEPGAPDKQPQSPYLRALLSGKTKTGNRARVFPMINPYNERFKPSPRPDKLAKDIGLTEKDWFKNYE